MGRAHACAYALAMLPLWWGALVLVDALTKPWPIAPREATLAVGTVLVTNALNAAWLGWASLLHGERA